MLGATTLGVTQFCIDNIGLHYFYVNLGFFHPMLMPTLGLTLISKVFFAKLGSFTQYCTHQHWVVQKQHVFRSLLGFFTQCCIHQHWVVQKQHVFRSLLGCFTQCCTHQHWVVKKLHVCRSTLGFFTQCYTYQHWVVKNTVCFNDNIGFFHPKLSPSKLGCEKKVFLMTMLGFSILYCPHQRWVVKK